MKRSILALTTLGLLLSCSRGVEHEPTARPTAPCELGAESGCNLDLQSEQDADIAQAAIEGVLERTTGASDHAPGSPEFDAMASDLVAYLEGMEGIDEIELGGRWLSFRSPAGYPYDIRLGRDVPLPPDAVEKLEDVPDDLLERLAALTEAFEEGKRTRAQELVTKNAYPLGRERKRARFMALWDWSFPRAFRDGSSFESSAIRFENTRDYEERGSVEVLVRQDPWVPEKNDPLGFEVMAGWEALDFLTIATHGGPKKVRLSTGIVVGYKSKGEDINEGLDCTDLRSDNPRGIKNQQRNLPTGIYCEVHDDIRADGKIYTIYSLSADRSFFLQNASNLANSRTFAIFRACAILHDLDNSPLKKAFLGNESTAIGADEDIKVNSTFAGDLISDLLRSGHRSNVSYAKLPDATISPGNAPGNIIHYPSNRGLRIVEPLTLQDPITTERLKQNDRLPVTLDEDGRPRLIELDAHLLTPLKDPLDRVILGTRYAFESELSPQEWVMMVEELDGPDGAAIQTISEPIPFLENDEHLMEASKGYTRRLKLDFGRDITTREEIHLRATVALPEGGVSTHTLTILPEPAILAWEAEFEGDFRVVYEETYAHAGYEDFTDQLLVYLTDSQENFLGMNGPVNIRLVLKDIEPGEVGVFDAPGKVLIDVDIPDRDIQDCPLLVPRVELSTFEDETLISGEFSGESFCSSGNGPSFTVKGNFYIDREE